MKRVVRGFFLAAAIGIGTEATLAAAPKATGLQWSQLRLEQQQILAPLREDWEQLEPQRRLNWVGIARRYPKMTPSEQARVRERMQDWARLTAEQRRAARDFYHWHNGLPPEKKESVRQKWEEYRQLPEERRRELAGLPPLTPRPVEPPVPQPVEPIPDRPEGGPAPSMSPPAQ